MSRGSIKRKSPTKLRTSSFPKKNDDSLSPYYSLSLFDERGGLDTGMTSCRSKIEICDVSQNLSSSADRKNVKR